MQASLGTAIIRRKADAQRARKGSADRFAFWVDGDVTPTSRAEMAGILAALQKINASTSAVLDTDSQSVPNDLERFRHGDKDSPPLLESTQYSDLLGMILQLLLHERMQLG